MNKNRVKLIRNLKFRTTIQTVNSNNQVQLWLQRMFDSPYPF